MPLLRDNGVADYPIGILPGVLKREDYELLAYVCWYNSWWDNTGHWSIVPYDGLSLTVLKPAARASTKLMQA